MTLSRRGSRPNRASGSWRSTRPTRDETFRARAIGIKEERAELVKHHLDVLWHDYFKPEHVEKVPNLHELFWNATKAASKVKASVDPADGQKLLDLIDEVDAAWKATGGEGEDAGRRPAGLTRPAPGAGPMPPTPQPQKPRRSAGLRRVRGPWRVAVVEASMAPAIEPGDWLLVDPTTVRWPRRGSVVVFREPDGGGLAVKRVAAGPGDRVAFAQGYLELAEDEAWLLSDATTETAAGTASANRSIRGRTGRSRSSCWSGARGSATRRCVGSVGSRVPSDATGPLVRAVAPHGPATDARTGGLSSDLALEPTMTSEPAFDPTAPLAGPPDPVGEHPDAEQARRSSVSHDRHDRRRTGARRADRRAARRAGRGRR